MLILFTLFGIIFVIMVAALIIALVAALLPFMVPFIILGALDLIVVLIIRAIRKRR